MDPATERNFFFSSWDTSNTEFSIFAGILNLIFHVNSFFIWLIPNRFGQSFLLEHGGEYALKNYVEKNDVEKNDVVKNDVVKNDVVKNDVEKNDVEE